MVCSLSGVDAIDALLSCFDVGFFAKLKGEIRAGKTKMTAKKRYLATESRKPSSVGEGGSVDGVGDSGREMAAACNVSLLVHPFRKLGSETAPPGEVS